MTNSIVDSVATKDEITTFLDRWLVNYRSLKLEPAAVEFVEKLIPHFSYEGKMFRGLFEPLVTIKRPGIDKCIDSWSKSKKGIKHLEKHAEYTFGSTSMSDSSIQVHTEEEFIYMNEDASPCRFDKVLEETHVGLDLGKLAEYVGYRTDFSKHISGVEEILVIRKMK